MKKLSWYYDQNRLIRSKSNICRAIENEADCSSYRKRDIFSYLPDPIRSHIVSFLPMKDAIKTTILSRRWRNTPNSLSELDFYSRHFKNVPDFRNFVDKILILHDGSDVRKFSLNFPVKDELVSVDHLNAWITFAIQHKVAELSLSLWGMLEKHERLPIRLFTCDTLSVLRLSFCSNLEWPTFLYFPVLKHLQFQIVTFDDENVTSKLFSSSVCPVLEYLEIFYCEFNNIHTLSISFPTLKYLQLCFEDPLSVNLSIPVLPRFDYEGPLPPNISCETLLSMCHFSLDICLADSTSEELELTTVRKILKGLHNVENLTLCKDIIEILSRDSDLLTYLTTSYHRLKHIGFVVSTTSHIETIACLLMTSPNLQTLYIKFENGNPPSSDIIHRQGYWQMNELSIAKCLKHLKSVELFDFQGSKNEMDIVRRLLEGASTLEQICISYACEVEKDVEKRVKISEKLSTFRRVSPHTTITFLINS